MDKNLSYFDGKISIIRVISDLHQNSQITNINV